MKKRICVVLALLLALSLLAGCGGIRQTAAPLLGTLLRDYPQENEEESSTADMLPFDQMPYARPDQVLVDMAELVDTLEEALDSGKSQRAVMKLLDRFYALYDTYDTMYSLAEVRACLDMTDSYYAAEYDWCYDHYTDVEELVDDLYYLCGRSALADALEADYFWEGFAEEYGDGSESAFTEEVSELLRQENSLMAEYRSLVADAELLVDGDWVDLDGYLSGLDDEDYRAAVTDYYRSRNERFAQLYIDLIRVRQALAKAYGFDSYEQMQYRLSFDRDYTPAQAQSYLEDIKTYLVPLYRQALQQGAYDDIDYAYLSDTELFDILCAGTDSMGGTVKEAFDFLADYRLYDIRYSEKKMDKSFQTYFQSYEAPFVFLDPYADLSDVNSFAHEFGHFLDAYVNYNAYETIDVAESFSQAMEYLMPGYLHGVLDEETVGMLYRIKLLDTLDSYIQQGSFAEFEHLLYSADPETLTAETVNGFFLQVAEEYGYYDGSDRDYYSMSWIDITHFFEYPFYVISYPVTNDLAMQIYELEQQEAGKGLDKYLELIHRDGSGLLEMAADGGLESPFAPGRVRRVAEDLSRMLSAEG